MSAHPQIQQRRRQVAGARRKRQLRRRLYLPLLLLALGALAFWLVFHSPLLDVDAVKVTGLDRTNPDQVAEITDQLLGDPLVTADLASARRFIAELPWVGAVEVSRSWRKGTVYVDILERKPVAVLQREGSYLLLDLEGRVLQSQTGTGGQLLIESSDWNESPAGQYEAAQAALQVAQELARHPQLASQVVSVSETTGDLFLKLKGSGWVYLNDTRELAAKLNSVETFLAHSQVECGKILDVNSPVALAIREGALCQQ